MSPRPLLAILLVGGAALLTAPAQADVKAGVDAWSRGDYTTAVREWEGPAQAGDADAMFNLGQAYRLGRGVPQDAARAEQLYARAAQAGHLQAADTYGLMLFQDGRRQAALPYVEDAARRGDPRSQYLLGIAHFNGDVVTRDWVRAYALLTLANGAGLPQAAAAVAQMDNDIPLAQRQEAAALAVEMKQEADLARATELASLDLADGAGSSAARRPSRPAAASPASTASAPAIAAAPSRNTQRPAQSSAVSPSVAAALAAVAEARQATGTESPQDAGASFARPSNPPQRAAAQPAPAPVPRPTQVAEAPVRSQIQPRPEPRPEPAPRPAPAARNAATGGAWRVQLGAFSVAGNAEQLWARLRNRPELSGAERVMVPAGNVTRLLAGGYASQAAADTACRGLKRAGIDCMVTQR
ncbi:sporulation protein [Altererythrobacter xixiisoli]|uniref:Sporulation protein n=1 Tax=Croceibacterium xixiisoli TaxID=1476466 RepID=A0A6I4TSH7_9SPHN|nr:sporulation protein [Croceibacterium xixiisoli]